MVVEQRKVFRRSAPGDLVFLVAVVIAVILIAHILFVVLGANAGNDIVHTDADWASWLATWFLNLFTSNSPKMDTFLNYGTATLVYLVVGGILRRVINDL